MNEVSVKNFGIMIAFVIPGFVTLWGVGRIFPSVGHWLQTSADSVPTVAGFMYLMLSSMAAGLTVSAIRWGVIDVAHHATGLEPPPWNFADLDERLPAFLALVENHYRYYQFYANMSVAMAIGYGAYLASEPDQFCNSVGQHLMFVVLELIFVAASRDTLEKYYVRVAQLFSSPVRERSVNDDQRFSSPEG